MSSAEDSLGLYLAWGGTSGYVLPHWLKVWKEKPKYTMILGTKLRPRSLFRIFERTLSNDRGDSFLVAGIGGVYTPEEHRRKGYALKLLSDCRKLLPKEYLGAILFSKDRDLYRRAGFRRISDLHGGLWAKLGDGVSLEGTWAVTPEDHF